MARCTRSASQSPDAWPLGCNAFAITSRGPTVLLRPTHGLDVNAARLSIMSVTSEVRLLAPVNVDTALLGVQHAHLLPCGYVLVQF